MISLHIHTSFTAYLVGLDIISCNHVILVEPWWNPHVEVNFLRWTMRMELTCSLQDQAISRTHRIGHSRGLCLPLDCQEYSRRSYSRGQHICCSDDQYLVFTFGRRRRMRKGRRCGNLTVIAPSPIEEQFCVGWTMIMARMKWNVEPMTENLTRISLSLAMCINIMGLIMDRASFSRIYIFTSNLK